MLIDSLLSLLDIASGNDRQNIAQTIKYTVTHDTSVNYYSTIDFDKIMLLEEIMNDDSISPDKAYIKTKVFHDMDKAVHQRGDFAFALSMSSSRIANYDSINNENTTGWYTGDGMTYIYNDDLTQYDPTYWCKVNYYQMAGTTVDTQKRQPESADGDDVYLSSKDFVGGAVTQDSYGTAAMWLDSYSNENGKYSLAAHSCSLEAQKSWFMFDDEIVALGAGIVSSDGAEVDTIIENRKSNNVKIISDQSVHSYEIKNVTASDIP